MISLPSPDFFLICTGERVRRILFPLLHAKLCAVDRLAQRGAKMTAVKRGFSRLKLMRKGSVDVEDKGELTKTCEWEI